MKQKFRIGYKVGLEFKGENYQGEIYIVDMLPKGFRYDVMCDKPEKLLIKHVFEKELHSLTTSLE